MLVRRHAERALVDLGDFTKTSLEFPSGFVLHASVLDEDRDVVPAVFTNGPPKMIYVAFKGIRASWGELVAKAVFYVSLEVVEAHAIDRILQTSVLHQGSESLFYEWTVIVFTFRLFVQISDGRILEEHGNSLDTVPIVPLG